MAPVRSQVRPSAIRRREEVAPIPKTVSRSSKSKRTGCVAWWCDKIFSRPADMLKHADAKHLGFYWKCTFEGCKEEASQKTNLETHIKNVHTRELSSVCSCGKGFTDPSALSRHRKSTRHVRNENAKRNPSGAVKRCRLEDAHDVTLKLLADVSYVPHVWDKTYHLSWLEYKPTSFPSSQPPASPSSSSSGCSTMDSLSSSGPPTPVLDFSDVTETIPSPLPCSDFEWYFGGEEYHSRCALQEMSLISDISQWTEQDLVSILNTSPEEPAPLQSGRNYDFGYNPSYRPEVQPSSSELTINNGMTLDSFLFRGF